MSHDDFDFEPIKGLPAVPPDGEQILWQGSPEWRDLAIHAFHVRKAAIYFGLLVAWYVISSAYDGMAMLQLLTGTSTFALISLACISLLGLLAWGYARSTIYTLTSKRLVLRHGIALPITINIPFSQIESAAMSHHAGGTGTVSVRPVKGVRLAWLALWPNVRAWHLARPEPSLRCISSPDKVASMLAEAIRHAEQGIVMAPAQGARPARTQNYNPASKTKLTTEAA